MNFRRTSQIHFVGIGGIGMSGIAELLLTQGYQVTGSDIRENARIRNLRRQGASIAIGHSSSNLQGADVVVRTSAVGESNVEIVTARKASIPVIPRAEMLAELMRLKRGIAIAGTHGKTTTTAMVSHLLQTAGFDPTVVVGGRMHNYGIGARLGDGQHIVVEADESDGSFLKLSPVISAVTNIEDDHLDYYGSIEKLERAFVDFINSVPFYGFTALCGDDPRLRKLLPQVTKPYATYGFQESNQLRAFNCIQEDFNQHFTVLFQGKNLGEIELPVPGKFNIQNSLAAISIALEMGVDFSLIKQSLKSFRGVARRFDYHGRVGNLSIYDDYAHHPTEVAETLKAARDTFEAELLVVFQPHRYSRTEQFAEQFGWALNFADRLCVTDIYPAGEKPLDGIDMEFLKQKIQPCRDRGETFFAPDSKAVLDWVEKVVDCDKKQVLFTLGAGDVVALSEPIQSVVAKLRREIKNEVV